MFFLRSCSPLKAKFLSVLILLSVSTSVRPVLAFSKEDPLIKKIENLVTQEVVETEIPGAAFGVVLDGKIVLRKYFGKRGSSNTGPVDGQTVFQIASMSKTLTSSLVVKLALAGKLKLDEPIAKYLPKLCTQNKCKNILIEHLLSHTSGISNSVANSLIEAQAAYPDIIKKTLAAKRLCAPGKCFRYNNVSFALLSEIVAKVTGTDFQSALKKEIFQPLEMKQTTTTADGLTKTQNVFAPHLFQRGKYIETTYSKAYYPFASAASINSNLDDMLQFLLAEMGFFPNVLSSDALRLLHTSRIAAPDASEWFGTNIQSSSYALGHRVIRTNGMEIVFHGGWIKGARTVIVMIPGKKFGFVFLQNTASNLHYNLMFDIARMLNTD